MGYTVTHNQVDIDGQTDILTTLSSTTGSQVVISNRAASVESLFLVGPDGRGAEHVWGHHDAYLYMAQKPARERTAPFAYSQSSHAAGSELRNAFLMRGGIPITFLPGRLKNGQMSILQPDASYENFELGISDAKSNSLLHFGPSKDEYFSILTSSESVEAQVAYTHRLGKNIENFPRHLDVKVDYSLVGNTLTRNVELRNNSNIHILFPMADHASLLPGPGVINDVLVKTITAGKCPLDDTKVAANRHLEVSRFDRGSPQLVVGVEELYYLSDPVQLLNKQTNIGLKITPSEDAICMYLWAHVTGNSAYQNLFISPQFYMGPATAILSVSKKPDCIPPVHLDQCQFASFRIKPGHAINFTHTYTPINQIT